MIDWRVDGTVLALRMAAEMGQEGVLAVIPWPTITLHKVHSTVPALLRDRYALATLTVIIISRVVGQHYHGCTRIALHSPREQSRILCIDESTAFEPIRIKERRW